MILDADKAIVMAEPAIWPDYLKTSYKVKYWKITDPAGRSLDFYRKTRDEIISRIENFLKE